MKKWFVLSAALALALATNVAWAKTALPKKAEAPVAASYAPPAEADVALPAQKQIQTMTPGLAYNFDMDVSLVDMYNTTFAKEHALGSWYYYPVYRAIITDVFSNGLGVTADIEKPGYAGLTYPTVKVNELYAKYRTGNFYYKLGRQVFGDTSDLVLGLQSDAIAFGWDTPGMDLAFFYAHTDVVNYFLGTMDGTMGFVPTFNFTPDMGLKGYLVIETQPITTTAPGAAYSQNQTNSLIYLGAKYFMNMPVGHGSIDVGAQPVIQFAMAQDAGTNNYDATSFGFKGDASFGFGSEAVIFRTGVHLVYTGGDPDVNVNTKAGFSSPNELVGSGPGLFNKIQDGAGPYSYVDGFGSSKIQQYQGVFAFGWDAKFEFMKRMLEPGIEIWAYSDTDKLDNVKSGYIGTEIDETINFNLNANLSFYQQLGYMMLNTSYRVPSGGTDPDYGAAIKFVLGTKLAF